MYLKQKRPSRSAAEIEVESKQNASGWTLGFLQRLDGKLLKAAPSTAFELYSLIQVSGHFVLPL